MSLCTCNFMFLFTCKCSLYFTVSLHVVPLKPGETSLFRQTGRAYESQSGRCISVTNYWFCLCLSLLMPRTPCYGSLPITPTREDILWILNAESKTRKRRVVYVYLYYLCVLGRGWDKSTKTERERLGNPLFEHFVLCALFVYEFPHWLGAGTLSPTLAFA